MSPYDEVACDALLADIRRAFADVRRGDGVTLHEAAVIDDYGSTQERAEARKLDTDERWWDVPDEDIESFDAALNFLDPVGFLYYVPAYLSWTLRNFETSESSAVDAVGFGLSNVHLLGDEELAAWNRDRWSRFTREQGAVILRFLRFTNDLQTRDPNLRFLTSPIEPYWLQFGDA